MHAMMDEFVVGMNVDHIRAGHEGLIDKSLVFGTVSFGYRGEITPGPLTRKGRPRRALVIDDTAADVVRKIFQWFVTDRLTVIEIVRRLNSDSAVPLPPKCRARRCWSRQAVQNVLRNSRYRGCWKYGVTETVWISSKDYARQVRRDQPLKIVQLEALRLVSDESWHSAQSLLAREAAKVVGRKPRDGDRTTRPRLLNGLFRCPTHDRMLYVGGPFGRSMFCKDCQAMAAKERPLFSLLPRVVSLEKTCAKIAQLIREDADLVHRIVASCQHRASQKQTPDPTQLTALANTLSKIDQRIQFVLRNPGYSEQDYSQSEVILKQLRHERAGLQAEQDALAAAATKVIVVPTEEDVRQMLDHLVEVLMRACAGGTEQAGRVRQIIELTTGGRIDLHQQGERRAKHGWLQGRFSNRLISSVAQLITGVAFDESELSPSEVVID